MAGLNKVMLIGNAGRDAELRYLPSGAAMVQFSLAVSNRHKSGDEWKDVTEWFNVALFGKSGESVAQYITKGKQVFVEGRLQTRSWDDDKGTKHYKTEVIAHTVTLLGPTPGGGRERAEEADDLPF